MVRTAAYGAITTTRRRGCPGAGEAIAPPLETRTVKRFGVECMQGAPRHRIPAMRTSTTSDPRASTRVIEDYEPAGVEPEVWARIRDEACAWVRAACPGHRRRALQLLYAATHLAAWCDAGGIPVTATNSLRDPTIERFCAWAEHEARFSATTRSTIRARLRHLAAANPVPGNRPAAPSLPRGRIRPPYTPAEAAGFLHLARNQRDPDRRRRLLGLLCAGLGAGCAPEDLRRLRGNDVEFDGGVTWVTIRGPRARRVPVLGLYAKELRWAAEHSGDRLLIGGRKSDRRSVTTALLHRIDGGGDLPPIEPGRLRSTWLATHLENGVRLDVLMAAAGLTTPTTIVDLVRHLPTPPRSAWALLSGVRR